MTGPAIVLLWLLAQAQPKPTLFAFSSYTMSFAPAPPCVALLAPTNEKPTGSACNVTIYPDGRLEVREGVTLNQAAREFWGFVAEQYGLCRTGAAQPCMREEQPNFSQWREGYSFQLIDCRWVLRPGHCGTKTAAPNCME